MRNKTDINDNIQVCFYVYVRYVFVGSCCHGKVFKLAVVVTMGRLCRFCFIKLNLLLIAIELAGEDGVDTTIAINPDSSVKIDLNFQGFFIAESADDVKRCVFSPKHLTRQKQQANFYEAVL